MPDITKIDLSRYRMRKAQEMPASAKRDIAAKDYASTASLIRNRSDYEDFYICSVADTNALFSGAESFCAEVAKYLEERGSFEL